MILVFVVCICLLIIQFFFVQNSWTNSRHQLESELDDVLYSLEDTLLGTKELNQLFDEALDSASSLEPGFHFLEAIFDAVVKDSDLSTEDISFSIFHNDFNSNSGQFIYGTSTFNEKNFRTYKKHHLCLSCILENDFSEKESYLELGLMYNDMRAMQLGKVGWLIVLSLFFIFFLSFYVIFLLKKLILVEILHHQKKNFINNLTHELKTPLFSIKLLSALIRENSNGSTTIDNYTEHIRKEAEHLESHVKRVLEFSALESAGYVQLVSINVAQFTSEILPSIRLKCDSMGATFIFENLCPSHLEICADALHLKNAINALIDNAIKYSGNDKQITLSVSSDGQGCCFEIKDCGIGISKNERKNVLESFYRVNNADSNDISGFGLGLSYVHQVVMKMNGELIFRDNKPKGTVVVIQFNETQ